VDAVLLDAVLAERGVSRNPGLVNQPAGMGVGHYIGTLARENAALRDRIDGLLRAAMQDGRLEAIFRKWRMWNGRPAASLRARSGKHLVRVSRPGPTHDGSGPRHHRSRSGPESAARGDDPLSAGAIARGGHHAAPVVRVDGARRGDGAGESPPAAVYGGRTLRALLTGWVELVRGTPLLLQLFVLYFGLESFVQLPAVAAAVLGLG
jgi:hypothetical protein